MHIKNQKGFTLIELIVVIAIIAILAVIVLVSVAQYITKSKNANIEANLDGIQSSAVAYANSHTSFSGFAASTGYTFAQTEVLAINNNVALTEYEPASGSGYTGFCACSVLLAIGGTTNYYCVDYAGVRKLTATACNSECALGANNTYYYQ